jgi:hypothetical protein
MNITPTSMFRRASSSEGYLYEVPFHFVIPQAIAGFNSEVPEQCMQLPPSLELGEVIVDESTGRRFAQPIIAYYLRAIVKFNARGNEGGGKTIDTSLPVNITTYTEEFPPTEIMDFPTEFKEEESKELRQHLIGRGLGTMKASIREPPALSYDIQSVCAYTEASMKLEFMSKGSTHVYQALQSLTFEAIPLLRIKTFYSLKSFLRLPSQSFLSLRGKTRLRDEKIKLKAKNIRCVCWKYVPELSGQSPGILLFTLP